MNYRYFNLFSWISKSDANSRSLLITDLSVPVISALSFLHLIIIISQLWPEVSPTPSFHVEKSFSLSVPFTRWPLSLSTDLLLLLEPSRKSQLLSDQENYANCNIGTNIHGKEFITCGFVSVCYFPSVMGPCKGQTLLVLMTWLRPFSQIKVSSCSSL